MITKNYDDGSKAFFYEEVDLVRVIKDKQDLGFSSTKIGDWGKVIKTRGNPFIAFVTVQFHGYSEGYCATLACWNLEPCDDKGNPLSSA